ncbi:MAG: type II toxin-antitoxin system prevent-host-death family antitoxin [Parvularcula sp.]|jgi:prevent-host-death family protein|nr:type II toxin-antitoxin system prevent-host-death family antitoxin [Parvularcula sp.]
MLINVQAAKTQLSRLLEQVESGEEVTIARAGKPIARLVSVHEVRTERRQGGFLSGQVVEHPDTWEPDEEMAELDQG